MFLLVLFICMLLCVIISFKVAIVDGLHLVMRKTSGGKTPLGVNRGNVKFAKTFLSGPQVLISFIIFCLI